MTLNDAFPVLFAAGLLVLLFFPLAYISYASARDLKIRREKFEEARADLYARLLRQIEFDRVEQLRRTQAQFRQQLREQPAVTVPVTNTERLARRRRLLPIKEEDNNGRKR